MSEHTHAAKGRHVDGTLFGAKNACFACSPTHPFGLRLTFEVFETEVVSRFTPEETHQGAMNVMHGGLLTTFADELAVWTIVQLRGHFGFTGKMTSRFLLPVRLGEEIVGRAKIVRNTSRLVDVDVEVTQHGQACFRSTMTFVLPDQAGAEKMLNGPVPEEWQQYFR